MDKKLPPPIVEPGERIVLHPEWIKMVVKPSYFKAIALPVPLTASEQNLILMNASAIVRWRDKEDKTMVRYAMRKPSLIAKKIGLSRNHRGQRLEGVLQKSELGAKRDEETGKLTIFDGDENAFEQRRR